MISRRAVVLAVAAATAVSSTVSAAADECKQPAAFVYLGSDVDVDKLTYLHQHESLAVFVDTLLEPHEGHGDLGKSDTAPIRPYNHTARAEASLGRIIRGRLENKFKNVHQLLDSSLHYSFLGTDGVSRNFTFRVDLADTIADDPAVLRAGVSTICLNGLALHSDKMRAMLTRLWPTCVPTLDLLINTGVPWMAHASLPQPPPSKGAIELTTKRPKTPTEDALESLGLEVVREEKLLARETYLHAEAKATAHHVKSKEKLSESLLSSTAPLTRLTVRRSYKWRAWTELSISNVDEGGMGVRSDPSVIDAESHPATAGTHQAQDLRATMQKFSEFGRSLLPNLVEPGL